MTTSIAGILAAAMQELIEADLTGTIGADHGERTPTRLAQRNGHRPKLLSTPAGDIDIAIPKLRKGSFFPALLEPRRRIDKALCAAIMTAYSAGRSTRKVDDLVKALGCDTGISKSSASTVLIRGIVRCLKRYIVREVYDAIPTDLAFTSPSEDITTTV